MWRSHRLVQIWQGSGERKLKSNPFSKSLTSILQPELRSLSLSHRTPVSSLSLLLLPFWKMNRTKDAPPLQGRLQVDCEDFQSFSPNSITHTKIAPSQTHTRCHPLFQINDTVLQIAMGGGGIGAHEVSRCLIPWLIHKWRWQEEWSQESFALLLQGDWGGGNY